MSQDNEYDDRPQHRENQAGRMIGRSRSGLAEDMSDKAAHHAAQDADRRRHEEAHLIRPGVNGTGNESNDEADNDVPNDVKHPEGYTGNRQPQTSRH